MPVPFPDKRMDLWQTCQLVPGEHPDEQRGWGTDIQSLGPEVPDGYEPIATQNGSWHPIGAGMAFAGRGAQMNTAVVVWARQLVQKFVPSRG